jgi:hypothetical protein
MRDALLPAESHSTGSDLGFHTLLLVTHLGDAALAALVADADAVAVVCTPAEADAILRHLAVEMVMILDDVAAADRIRIQTRAGAATFVFGAPSAPSAPEPAHRRRPTTTLLSIAA